MKFKIKCLRDGKEEFWKYDNESNEIFDPYEKLINFDKNLYFKEEKKFILSILLGYKCNFHCEYCSQKKYRNFYSSSPKFIDEFVKKLKILNLDVDLIRFWGGEPLVYWKVIKKLVPLLKNLYPKCRFVMTSNGSLLTRDKVDFMNKFDISFVISHDGIKNNYRDYDVLKDDVVFDSIIYAQNVFKNSMNHISFTTTHTSGNTNALKTINFFKKNVSENTKCNVRSIIRCHDSKDKNQLDSVKLNQDDLKEYSDSIFEILNKKLDERSDLEKRRNYLINSIITKRKLDYEKSSCNYSNGKSLLVDLNCHILKCQNKPDIIGHLDDINSINYKYINFLNNKKCRECIVVHSCKGGCPIMNNKEFDLTCSNIFALHWGIFRSMFAALFGVYVLSYEKINE